MKRLGFPTINYDGADPAAGGGDPWFKGVEGITAEEIGHIQTKGWDKETPALAAVKAMRAHREAERFVGTPADQLIKLPKELGAPEWKGVWERLGAPKDATGYDFSTIEKRDGEGKVVNAKFVDTMRATAAELNLPKDVATRVAAAIDKFNADNAAAETADTTARVTTEREALAKNWGTTVDKIKESPHFFVAQNAAKALGVSPEAVATLETTIGYRGVMEMFHKIGTKIGEDKFIRNPNDGGSPVMTREQAVARLAELKRDKGWTDRMMDGDLAAKREFRALNVLIVGDDTAASRGL